MCAGIHFYSLTHMVDLVIRGQPRVLLGFALYAGGVPSPSRRNKAQRRSRMNESYSPFQILQSWEPGTLWLHITEVCTTHDPLDTYGCHTVLLGKWVYYHAFTPLVCMNVNPEKSSDPFAHTANMYYTPPCSRNMPTVHFGRIVGSTCSQYMQSVIALYVWS